MNPLSELTQLFTKFPGIGPRQAGRFAYFIMKSNAGYVENLMYQIKQVRSNMTCCPISFHYFYKKTPDQVYSPLITDKTRDPRLLMIVEKDTDIEPFEKSKSFNGHYFVLGGLAPLIDTETAQFIHIDELLTLIENKCMQRDIFPGCELGLTEVIFALGAHKEADRTTDMIKQKIEYLQGRYGFTVSTLGRGFSSGTEIEYSDTDTLDHAFKNRR